ncbi:glycosyl transferase family 9 [Geobacter metallireducens RCH3]|uniref:ADP-heptose--lipopolysaccharide heptosyltransferase n=1 Tax=Geobacter metallireducens (strain ATCC 53774 / DSM 7210 / GS-15) TaxID=269799 RepID=Q39RM5_GEOMG|nr:glycosyltransferase family 9 protein [Geobacter metallireducens]ABB33099.1 ADP-heptose--lipopolysaccharide heptosyltransferase [Geobacter metallireducens GS-15]EHP84176.1 glycosyl transferase family 9 [Geobacter metallireducens RCH3]
MTLRNVRTDCIHLDGYKPCPPHKRNGVVCGNCAEYRPARSRILILKVGAAGEVIRNTPILHRLRALYPGAEITWMTDYPDFIPRSFVQRVLKFDWKNALLVQEQEYDLLLSLDKDTQVCAVANRVRAAVKKGFLLGPQGKIVPADDDARRKWLTGIFDDLMKENTRHYVEETFEICGWEWAGERYILENVPRVPLSFPRTEGRPLIGLNTGAGSIWPTRIWPEDSWRDLAAALQTRGYDVLLLGGPDEHEKNLRLARESGARYEGLKNFLEFSGLVGCCDLVVTAVTMALHIAIALERRIVLLDNIFNASEFYLYGLGSIVQPELDCLACYKRAFDGGCPVEDCMELISVADVAAAVETNLSAQEPVSSP